MGAAFGALILPATGALLAGPSLSQFAVPAATRSNGFFPSPRLHLGLLIEMRDESLGRLIAAPRDMEAMEAIVRIQRFLGANNPRALRHQAKAYVRAAAGGAEHEEHFTPQALRLLALADLLAATQIEGARMAARSEPTGPGRSPLLSAGLLVRQSSKPLPSRPGGSTARVTPSVRRRRTATAAEGTTRHSLPARTSLVAAPVPSLVGLVKEGRRLYSAGWYGPALARFREATRRAPDSSLAYLWWGRAAYKVSRFQEARQALVRASNLAGDTETGRQARALLRTLSSPGLLGE
jgi:tetratricopeptide (TPR) repeat protein